MAECLTETAAGFDRTWNGRQAASRNPSDTIVIDQNGNVFDGNGRAIGATPSAKEH